MSNTSIISEKSFISKNIETPNGQVAYGTDIGTGYKDRNEDAIVATLPNSFAVIDGMGGLPNAKEAATILAEELGEGFESGVDIKQVQARAAEKMKEQGITEGGAVYLSFQIDDFSVQISQAGDAKCIIYNNDGLLFESEGERMMFALANAVRGEDSGRVTTYPSVEASPGTRIIAATDGLWDSMSVAEAISMTQTIATPRAVVSQLITLTKKQMESGEGKPDNVSIVVYDFEEEE